MHYCNPNEEVILFFCFYFTAIYIEIATCEISSTIFYLLASGCHVLSLRVKSAAQRKNVDRPLLLAQVLVGDLVSEF